MTVDTFVQEVKRHGSWVYDVYISKLYDRQWAQWELLTIAGVLSLLLLWKVRRRRRKASAAKIVYTDHTLAEPSIVGVRLASANGTGRNGEDSQEADERSALQIRRKYQRWTTATDESDWPDQPVRDLRREIIKRDQHESRLEREVDELTDANEQLEREVAGLMAVNERLLRQATEGRRVVEVSSRR